MISKSFSMLSFLKLTIMLPKHAWPLSPCFRRITNDRLEKNLLVYPPTSNSTFYALYDELTCFIFTAPRYTRQERFLAFIV